MYAMHPHFMGLRFPYVVLPSCTLSTFRGFGIRYDLGTLFPMDAAVRRREPCS